MRRCKTKVRGQHKCNDDSIGLYKLMYQVGIGGNMSCQQAEEVLAEQFVY